MGAKFFGPTFFCLGGNGNGQQLVVGVDPASADFGEMWTWNSAADPIPVKFLDASKDGSGWKIARSRGVPPVPRRARSAASSSAVVPTSRAVVGVANPAEWISVIASVVGLCLLLQQCRMKSGAS